MKYLALKSLSMLALITVSAGVGAWLFQPETPESISPTKQQITASVGTRDFDDATGVVLDISQQPATILTAPVSGRVTTLNCITGQTINSGDTLLSINGTSLIALSTSTPLWRDLPTGTTGADVTALQQELQRLGKLTQVSGKIDSTTRQAVASLLGRKNSDITSISPNDFIWLPEGINTVQECLINLGGQMEIGAEILKLQPRISSIQISNRPPETITGERILQIDGQNFPVNGEGGITDASHLAQVQQTSSYIGWLNNPEAGQMRGQYKLATATTVNTVPPAALYNINASTGCLTDGKEAYRVNILSSQLGNSIVQFEANQKPKEVLVKPEEPPACE